MSDDPNDERAEIVAFLSTMSPPIGVVNDRERWSLASLVDPTSGRLHGYFVTNADENGRNVESRMPLDTDAYTVKRMWTVRGFYQADDEGGSEKLFRAELNRIMNALTPHRSLGHTVLSTTMPYIAAFLPTEGEQFQFHYAEIVFGTRSEGHYTPD